MKKAISEIVVDETERIRQDIGDLEQLQSSIEKVGLINPVLIDENNRLIAGYRRLTVCKNLGWTEIEVSMVSFDGDLIKMLDAEVAENLYRKDFTQEEILAAEKRREEIIELLREKRFWERLWLWIKQFFLPEQQDVPQQKIVKQTEEPAAEQDKGDVVEDNMVEGETNSAPVHEPEDLVTRSSPDVEPEENQKI